MVLTRAMEEQIKALLEAINAVKNGQEAMKEEMKSGQEEMLKEMKEGQENLEEKMEKGQEEMKKEMLKEMKEGQEELKKEISNIDEKIREKLDERIGEVEEKLDGRIGEVEEKLDGRIGEVEEKLDGRIGEVEGKLDGRIGEVEENFCVVKKRMQELETKLATSQQSFEVPKFMSASSAPVKLSTYDGKSNWQVYKTQFSIVAETNGWDENTKACQLVASLRGEAAEILQTVSNKLNFEELSNALELRYGEKFLKDHTRIQLKSRHQKNGESLQEFASEIERLSHLAFTDCPADVRDMLAVQYFVDGLRENEIQKAVRMADVKDLKSAILHALKIEFTIQASRKDSYKIRGVTSEDLESKLMEKMDNLAKELEVLKSGKRIVRCWGCEGTGHIRRNCPRNVRRGDGNTTSTTQQGN